MLLDVSKQTSIFDCFVIATGTIVGSFMPSAMKLIEKWRRLANLD